MARIKPKRAENQPQSRSGDGRTIRRQICCPEGSGRTANPRQQGNPSVNPPTAYLRAVDLALRGKGAVRGQSQESTFNEGSIQVVSRQLRPSAMAVLSTFRGEDGRRRGMAGESLLYCRNEGQTQKHHERSA